MVLPSDPLVGGGSHVVIIGALPIVGPDLQPAPVPFLQLGLLVLVLVLVSPWWGVGHLGWDRSWTVWRLRSEDFNKVI